MAKQELTKADIIGYITEIIKRTFAEVDRCFKENQETEHKTKYIEGGSRLLFPCYSRAFRKETTRLSEQELRFIFVEQFTQFCNDPKHPWNAFYSVETPTEWKYRFSESDKPQKDDSGRSAMVDVCIYDEKGIRLCLIEFKAGNPDGFCYVKDFVKLSEEISYKVNVPPSIKEGEIKDYKGEEPLRFFIHILEKKGPNIPQRIIDYCEKDERIDKQEMKRMVKGIHFFRHYINDRKTEKSFDFEFFDGAKWKSDNENKQ